MSDLPPEQQLPSISPMETEGAGLPNVGSIDDGPVTDPVGSSNHATIPIVLVAIGTIIIVVLLFGWACYRKYRTEFLGRSSVQAPMTQTTQTALGSEAPLGQQQGEGGGYAQPPTRINSYDADPVPPYPAESSSDTVVQIEQPGIPVPGYSSPQGGVPEEDGNLDVSEASLPARPASLHRAPSPAYRSEVMRKQQGPQKDDGSDDDVETTVQDEDGRGGVRWHLDRTSRRNISSHSPIPRPVSSHGQPISRDIASPPTPALSYDQDAASRHWRQKQHCDTPPP
ncbi:MAG: hypothetical protein DHS80DRAFT_30025 [Piptocephalis tieghemiana]|nr:MAG: hypothetical protein DHS80DRAFT_30025 [Piptocephalis tieghemiana]